MTSKRRKLQKVIIVDYNEVSVPESFRRWTYKDRYTIYPEISNKDAEFMLTSNFRQSYMESCISEHSKPSRKSDNMVPRYMLFEFDTISLDEQIEIINKMDWDAQKYIQSITFSGSKSIHILFSVMVNDNDITNREFKRLWRRFGEVVEFLGGVKFLGLADSACADLSRLTRNPNGIRDNGVKQSCWYFNEDVSTFDLTDLLEDVRREISEEETYSEEPSEIKSPTTDIDTMFAHMRKQTKSKKIVDMVKSGNLPPGENWLSLATTVYKFLVYRVGYDAYIAEEWVRDNILIPVSQVHPTNISPSRAKHWTIRTINK